MYTPPSKSLLMMNILSILKKHSNRVADRIKSDLKKALAEYEKE